MISVESGVLEESVALNRMYSWKSFSKPGFILPRWQEIVLNDSWSPDICYQRTNNYGIRINFAGIDYLHYSDVTEALGLAGIDTYVNLLKMQLQSLLTGPRTYTKRAYYIEKLWGPLLDTVKLGASSLTCALTSESINTRHHSPEINLFRFKEWEEMLVRFMRSRNPRSRLQKIEGIEEAVIFQNGLLEIWRERYPHIFHSPPY